MVMTVVMMSVNHCDDDDCDGDDDCDFDGGVNNCDDGDDECDSNRLPYVHACM